MNRIDAKDIWSVHPLQADFAPLVKNTCARGKQVLLRL